MQVQPHKLARRDFLRTSGALLVGTAASSALLAACGQAPAASAPTTAPAAQPTVAVAGATTGPAAAQKTKIRWIEWITPEISEEKMQGVLNAFYATDAGRSIEIERISLPFAQVRDRMVAMNLAGAVPDILNMNGPWAVELAEQGVLEPLNTYLAQAGKDWVSNLVQGPMQPWKGQTYLVPLTSIPFLLFYNEKKLAAAGFSDPPRTWAEVESMGPKLTDRTKNTFCYASGMAAQDPYNGPEIELFPLIYQSNDTVLKDGKPNLTSPAAVKAVSEWLKLVNDLKVYAPGALTSIEKDKLEAFGAEQTALMWSNVAHVTVLGQRSANLKFGLAPLPQGDTFGTVLTGWNTSLAKGSKEKKAAWEFIYWLTSADGNARMTLAAKHLPGNTTADVSEMFQADPRLKVPLDILGQGRVFMEAAGLPETTTLWRILTEAVQDAANKKKSTEEALASANTDWTTVLQKYA